jgi:hypothetical protein
MKLDKIAKEMLKDAKEARKDMGMGPLGSPHTVFATQFRWTLDNKNMPIEHFMKAVAVDFANRILRVQSYEVIISGQNDVYIHRWLEQDLSKEHLILTTYDGCGVPLYEYVFENLKIVADAVNFDYELSDVSIRHFSVSYESVKRNFLVKLVEPPKPKPSLVWKLNMVGDPSSCLYVVDTDRPTLDVEEVSVKHKEQSVIHPGKATWRHMKISLHKQCDMGFLSELIKQNKSVKLALSLVNETSNEVLETWTLIECVLVSLITPEDANEMYEIKIRFGKVEYESKSDKEQNEGKKSNDVQNIRKQVPVLS